MITLIQKAVRYAVGSSKSDQYQEIVNCRPKLEDFVTTSHSAPETKEFEGLVTSIDCSCIVISQDVYCEPSKFPADRKVSLGAKVRGSAQRAGKHEMWRAEKIELVQEEWDTSTQCQGRDKSDGLTGSTSTAHLATSSSEAISCRDLAEGIPGIFKSDVLSSVLPRSSQPWHIPKSTEVAAKTRAPETIIGKVTGIYGDAVTLNDNIGFTLTSSNCNLILVKGDWIVCDISDSSSVGSGDGPVNGMIQVSSVKPLRKKKIRGEVTHSFQTHFIINEEIFCSRTVPGGTFAKARDAMTVEVIESEQGGMCWRAIALASPATAPSTQEPGAPPGVTKLISLPEIDVGENRIKKLLENKEDIIIPESIRFPPVVLGAAAFTDVSIKNTGPAPRTLRRVYFVSVSQESQFSVVSCSVGGVVDGSQRTLQPGVKVVVKLCCAGSLIGLLRQLCIFEFEEFQIGRHVSATVEDPLIVSLAPVSSCTPRPHSHSFVMPKDRGIIVGQRSFKPSPFIPVKLPPVRVPENLWHEVSRGDLFNVASVLREPLTADNYKRKFTLLLHLEEIKMTQQMREFDMARASFTVCGEYLSLSVPGLAEKRPSLLIGDTVVATDLCSPGEVEYEGCIHQVLSTQILLKFHPSFHSSYCGEDYKVRFNFNRTPLRRCHFALDYTMKQLSQDVLFPSRLKLQLPQVCYIDPEVQNLTKNWKNCPSRSNQLPFMAEGTYKSADVSECDRQTSSQKLSVVARLFNIPPQGLDSYTYNSENEIRVSSSLDKDVLGVEELKNGVFTGRFIEDSCPTKSEDRRKGRYSQKQEYSHYSSSFNNCPPPSHAKSSISQELVLDSNVRVACFNRQGLAKKEAKQPLRQEKSSLPEPSKTTELADSHQVEKCDKSSTCDNKLIPQSLDLALCRSARMKTSGNKDKALEEEALRNGKYVSEKEVNNYTLEGHDQISEKKNALPDGCKRVMDKYSYNEVYENKYEDSKGKQSKKSVGDTMHSILKKKSCYVIPVLPVCSTGKKTQDLKKLPTLTWCNKSLNHEQKLAVRRILEGTTRPLPYIIFGPPGTGKTVTLVEAALQILTMIHHSRLLIVTPSNSASDLVAERLMETGQLGRGDMVRLIAYQRFKENIPEVILPYCCNGDELGVRAHQRVIVTTATCAGVLYMQGLHKGHFSHILVDEAGQLTEPECLVPLGLVNRAAGQIVLVGDPRQLGPIIQSHLAKRGGLQQSLLQRLCQSVLYQAQEVNESSAWVFEPSLVTQLVRNYRSHPHILAVPSRLFYHNTLQACADVKAQEQLLSWKELPNSSCPVFFHGVVGTNFQEGDSPSWFNPAEAFQVVRYTKSLLLHAVEERNIGIITPYRKQIEKMHKLLTTFGIEGVKVGSVEEFQGQERSVILISTVRSSTSWVEEDAKYNLGFIRCCKRFNVAVTRAQGLLVVVGNPFLLSMDDSWKELIKFCIGHGSYRGPELEDQVCR